MEYVEPIANYLGSPVAKYFRYHRKLNDYVRNLKRTRDQLNDKKEVMELQLKAELFQHVGKRARKEVENWLEDAKRMISEAEDVETKVNNGRYILRAYNGMLVDEKTQEMQKFLDNAADASESLVIDGPSVGLPLPTPELVGDKAMTDEIWSCLMQEEVTKIGIWGMGGVGKTTIMKHIHNELLKEPWRFGRVIWVTISKEFNVLKLQDDIATELKIEFPKEADQLKRAAILSNMMVKGGKHVLIFDDVWDKFSMEEVGIPEPNSNSGCKLVLTTRSEQVCKYMGCEKIKVKPLSEEEALLLFLNRVGPNKVQNTDLMPTLRLVVKECAGLPLTIVVVAGTLKGEDDPHTWMNTLEELKDRIGMVDGVEAEVIECLKISYNRLKGEKLKHCFLYCALYPEDFKIVKKELIDCWIDEGFIDDMKTRQGMKVKGHTILKILEGNCLLENAIDKWNQPCVKMHDAVRDMAISITATNPRYMIQAGLQLGMLVEEEKWATDINKVSLMRNSISRIAIDMSPPKCQLLTTLLLQHNPLEKIPDSFFANMHCLSVLNLSYTMIECLPDSVSELRNLTALLLFNCVQLRHVPCLSELQGLKKLDLGGTGIEDVPEGMDMLINLRYLDLTVRSLKGILVGVLPKLCRLQYLSFSLLNDKTSLKAEEVVALEKLEYFCGRFEDMNELRKFLSSMQQQCKKDLIKYHLCVGSHEGLINLRDKAVVIRDVEVDGDVLIPPVDIQELHISNCHCEGIECVVSLSSCCTSSPPPFQSLEVLVLENLPKLSGVIGSGATTTSISTSTFSRLERLCIRNCGSMKTVIPHWLLPNLQNLKIIHVLNCCRLVEIFGGAPPPPPTTTTEDGRDIALIKFKLPKLAALTLFNVPELKRICSKSGVMVCDSLQIIQVFGECSKLKRIPAFVAVDGNGQPYEYAPPSLEIHSRPAWWESLEWSDDHPNFKHLLQHLWRPM